MELTTTEFNRLLSNVTNLNVDDETVKSLGFIAESTETSQRIVEALLASQSPSENKDAVVYATMRILEAIADKAKAIACIFMAHLYPIADALYMHDICDSIDLWVADCDSLELKQHLLILASSQKDDDMRRHYEQMAQ